VQVEAIMDSRKDLANMMSQPGVRHILWVLRKLYVVVFMGYCLIPFVLLSYTRWTAAFSNVYWVGHIFFLPWLFFGHIAVKSLRPKTTKKD